MNTTSTQHLVAQSIAAISASNGKKFWRGLEEIADSEPFLALLQQELPQHAAQWTNALSRRQFLTLMGASLALAGVAGCSPQPPVGKIMPYTRQPEAVTPGQPRFFATTMTLAGSGVGLVVKSYDGRPVKVEGNPKHPASRGASNVFAQAAVLGLYDPDRSQSITHLGQPRGWASAQSVLRAALSELKSNDGRGLRILTETVVSPTLADQIAGQRKDSVLREFPEAKWCQYEATHCDAYRAGSQLAFGQAVDAIYDFTAADVIVSLDADFLSDLANGLCYTRDFMKRRGDAVEAILRSETNSQLAETNRLYVVESMPSITGAAADHKISLRPSETQNVARELAAQLGITNASRQSELSEYLQKWISVVANDLLQHRGSSLVVPGGAQPIVVHAIAHAINDVLGNVGKTVRYIDPVAARPTEQIPQLQTLTEEMAAGKVQLLLILGGNPVFNASANLEFAKHLSRVPVKIHLGLYADETAAQCDWHIPEAHFLESWSDARAFNGAASIVQPLIAPLYGGHSVHELLAALFEETERPGHEIVKSFWRANWPTAVDGAEFERQWEFALKEGIVANSAFADKDGLVLRSDWRDQISVPPASSVARAAQGNLASGDISQQVAESLEVAFQSDPTIYDGRFANNGWLQELPKPNTKLTWDNAACIGPATAAKLGLIQTFGDSGGEHGQALVDVVELTLHDRTLEAPVWILPGHAEGCVTLHFGYGRTQAGKVGSGTGFNIYELRSSSAPHFDLGLKIRKIEKRFSLACTQMHHSMEGREPILRGTFAELKANQHFLIANQSEEQRRYQRELVPGHELQPVNKETAKSDQKSDTQLARNDPRLVPLSLYPEHDYSPPKNKWGMSIDLTKCTGCSACVIACQAENNIPVVGKTEVARGREMHWLRIDRYYQGDVENPATFFQPVPCMHCENAPCELVCPVGATVHSADGLNDMVYNRCVGTRYCSNNCPYKVRRFNFFEYADFHTENFKAGRNPEVTVRSRGVMEKCTYCVQRIRAGQIAAELAGEAIRDGDVRTACQQACPAQAIVFGDMNDAASEVTQRKASPLDYGLLAELNTRPRSTYLAALRNPNPELQAKALEDVQPNVLKSE